MASNVAGVQSVANPRPSLGGADVQDIDELRRDAPAELRTLQRAVTGGDYGALALQVGTVARAKALPLTHPNHRNVEVPGAVTVLVVPDGTEPPHSHLQSWSRKCAVISTGCAPSPPSYTSWGRAIDGSR